MQKGRMIFSLLAFFAALQTAEAAHFAGGGEHGSVVNQAKATTSTVQQQSLQGPNSSAASNQKFVLKTPAVEQPYTIPVSPVKPLPPTVFNRIFNSTNHPDWISRTDINYSLASYNKPLTAIETLQPIFADIWHTWFWRGRLSYMEIIPTVNFGVGYRYLPDSQNVMFGLNMFYDETTRYTNKRVGWGAEVYTKQLTFRANYYDAFSGHRIIGIQHFAQALKGYDYSIETPFPHVSWARVTLEGYHWIGKNTSSVSGGLINFRIYPARQLEINTGYAHDNSKGNQAFIQLAYYLGSPASNEYSATSGGPHNTFAARNLEDMRLEKVRREDQIIVETSRGFAPVPGVIVSRPVS